MLFLKSLLLLTVFLLPLITLSGNLGYEETKVITFIRLCSISAVIWLIILIKNRRKISLKINTATKLSTLFFLILVVSSIQGINPTASIFGRPPYIQGLILYFMLLLFCLMVSFARISIKTWGTVLILSATLVSLIAIKDYLLLLTFEKSVVTYNGRVISTFGQPNLYSGYILLTLPFLFNFLKKSRARNLKLWVFLISVLYAGILISQSRASFIISSSLIVIWFLSFLSTKFRKVIVFSTIIVVLIALGISYIFSTGLIYKEIFEPKNTFWLINNSPEKRIYIWPRIFNLSLNRPILGYGLENIEQVFSPKISLTGNPPENHSIQNLLIDRSHNYLLDLLFYSGLVGVIAWVILVWNIFRTTNEKVIKVSLIIFLIWSQFQILSVAHLMFFWLLAGLTNRQIRS